MFAPVEEVEWGQGVGVLVGLGDGFEVFAEAVGDVLVGGLLVGVELVVVVDGGLHAGAGLGQDGVVGPLVGCGVGQGEVLEFVGEDDVVGVLRVGANHAAVQFVALRGLLACVPAGAARGQQQDGQQSRDEGFRPVRWSGVFGGVHQCVPVPGMRS